MNKILIAVFSVVIIASLIFAWIAFSAEPEAPDPIEVSVTVTVAPSPNLTVVKASEQTEVTRPGWFPDPSANWIELPEGDNLAEGKAVDAGEVTEVYNSANTVDGDTNTYWESKGIPADITIDLADTYTIRTVAVRLNPAPIWEARSQSFEVLVSGDGTDFTVAAPNARYDFDPDSGNIARVDFDPTPARYVRLVFTEKSSDRSNGAQAAEICVYE